MDYQWQVKRKVVEVMSHTLLAVRLALAVNVFLFIYITSAGVGWSVTWAAVAILAYVLMGGCGITATFHRYYSHRSFEFRHPAIKVAFTLFGTLAASGSALAWASVHRLHHKHSDTEKDPHSPDHDPIGTLSLNYKVKSIGSWHGGRDLISDSIVRFTHRYYLAIVLSYIFALFLVSIEAVYFLFVVPSLTVLVVSALTNYLQHKDEHPRNVPWLALFNFGEAWHVAHHESPKSPSNSRAWFQIDPAAWIIKAAGQ